MGKQNHTTPHKDKKLKQTQSYKMKKSQKQTKEDSKYVDNTYLKITIKKNNTKV